MADELYTGGRGTSRTDTRNTDVYTSNSSSGVYTDRGTFIDSGLAVYPKAGQTVAYFEDQAGTKQVGRSGGSGGQDSPPTRSGTELVGFTTGKADNNYIQVSWVNRWWQDANVNLLFPWKSTKGEYKTENKISWVRRSAVDLKTSIQTPEQIQSEAEQKELENLINNTGSGDTTGIDTTTLGIAAVGAALLFTRKKKRK